MLDRMSCMIAHLQPELRTIDRSTETGSSDRNLIPLLV